MAESAVTQTMNISGEGFYPGGSASIVITAVPTAGGTGPTSTYTATVSPTGTVTFSIAVSSINGIFSATSLQMYAQDMTTGDKSNTVIIQLATTTVAPTLVAPTTPIQLLIS